MAPRFIPESVPDVERCRAGDASAIEDLFRSYSPVVERVIARLVGPTPDIEDLVQTTFLEGLRVIGRFRGESTLTTWLTGIAVHVAQHHLRAGRVRRHVPLELVPEEALGGTSGADRSLDERRVAARLHELLDRIPAKQRVALLLYSLEDHSTREVAQLMDATETATRSRIFLARRALRKLIAADRHLSESAQLLLEGRGGAQ